MLTIMIGVSSVLFVHAADDGVGMWSVNRTITPSGDFNGECIMLRAKITLQFNLTDHASTTNETTKVYSIVVPTNATATGSCEDTYYITLTFFDGWTARFDINVFKNETDVALNFTLDAFTLKGNYSTAPIKLPKQILDKFEYDITGLTLVHADIGKSYACVTGNTVIEDKKDEFALRFDALQMQVNTANVTTFAQGEMCEADKKAAATSDLVPIIVGACLALLVIIVLVAYLIGRVRAKRQGYASV